MYVRKERWMNLRSRHYGESAAVFIALLLASSMAAAQTATQPEETLAGSEAEAVRATFQDYKQALMDGEGGVAAGLVRGLHADHLRPRPRPAP